jgi:hypothetical protein
MRWGPVDQFLPIVDMPSGVRFSFSGSFEIGTGAFPLSAIPLQSIVDKVEAGDYQAHPSRVFAFGEIAEAHRVMEWARPTGSSWSRGCISGGDDHSVLTRDPLPGSRPGGEGAGRGAAGLA